MFSDELGSKFCVASLVQCLPFLTCLVLTDTVDINAAAAELAQEFGREDHTGKISNWHQVELTAPRQFPQPEVIMLLIHQGRHRELQWIASLNVQFRSEC